MRNPFERFECWHPRCYCYAPFGVRLRCSEVHQSTDNKLCCNACDRPVRHVPPGFLSDVWGWIFRGEAS